MDHLLKLTESVLAYISPVAKRRRPMDTITPGSHNRLAALSRPFSADMSEPRDIKTKAILRGRVSKKYLSPGDTSDAAIVRSQRLAKRAYKNELDSRDEESEKRADEEQMVPATVQSSPGSAIILNSGAEEYPSSNSSDANSDDLDGEEEELEFEDAKTLAADHKVAAYLSYQEAMEKNKVMFQEIRDESWHADEIALFEKLAMRGYEPLMSTTWYHNFRTCPAILFTEKDEDTFINTISGNEFRATNALESLTTLGSRVRALIQVKKSPEFLMKKEIENYITWSERDAGYSNKKFTPLITIVAGNSKKNPDLEHATREVTQKMNFLASEYRSALALPEPHHVDELGNKELYSRPVPVVFGVVTLGSVAVILSLDGAALDGREPKTITSFDFEEDLMDVWNGIAIAVLCVTVRNMVLEQIVDLATEVEEEIVDVDA